jgi:outer membrane protein assembly factor BamA
LRFRFLTVLLLVTFGRAVCLGQQVFRVIWDGEENSRKKEIHDFKEQRAAEYLADSVADLLQRQGFLEGFFREEIKADTLVINWVSGRLFRWESIDSDNVPEALLNELGQPDLSYPAPYQWMEKGLELAENVGFPFAELRIDSLEVRDGLLTGRMVYQPGPYITWDSLEIGGESKTKITYLQLISGLTPGEPFSQRQLEHAAQTIRSSPYFTLVGAPGLSFQTQQAKPFFTIQDRRVNVFDGVIGLLPNENEPGKVLITGEVDLRLFHLGGKGRDFSVQWQRLNIQSQSLEIKAKEAFVFRSPLDFQVGFSLLKQDSSFVNRTFELDFGYRISDDGYLNFFTRRQAGDLISASDIEDDQVLPTAIDYRWNQYGMGIDWNKLDSPVSPRKGSRIQAQFSLGNKKILENTGLPEEVYEGLDETSPQYQGWFSGEKHIYVKPGWGMWLRGVAGFLENENLFLNEFSRLGGLKSIRGFNEKSFFARRYGYVNLEQRLFFDQNSFLVVFTDLGIIENPYENQKIDRPFSFGTGINLDTDGGLFSFVFALGRSTTQPLSFSYSRIHFGYLARF